MTEQSVNLGLAPSELSKDLARVGAAAQGQDRIPKASARGPHGVLLVETHLGFETQTAWTKDHHEAGLSFRDNRPPKFTGE